jgi:hypothetical protein
MRTIGSLLSRGGFTDVDDAVAVMKRATHSVIDTPPR